MIGELPSAGRHDRNQGLTPPASALTTEPFGRLEPSLSALAESGLASLRGQDDGDLEVEHALRPVGDDVPKAVGVERAWAVKHTDGK
ncbi:MAG TPA: hypothetical protein VHV82_20455 [Sporichthyaceae bacterium]|nr:hypothetical protein [Sporichthyaceae bacterium]